MRHVWQTNLLRVTPSFAEAIPVRYRTASPEQCDHCNKRITTRKETFVVQHEDGTYRQVGRNCLQDFLGGKDPHAIAAYLELVLGVLDTCAMGEGGGSGSGGVYSYSLRSFLTSAAMFVRTEGWVSRTQARNSGSDFGPGLTATADQVLLYMGPAPRGSLLGAIILSGNITINPRNVTRNPGNITINIGMQTNKHPSNSL